MNHSNRPETGRREFLQSAALAVAGTTARQRQSPSPATIRVGMIGAGLRGSFLTTTLTKMADAWRARRNRRRL